MTTPIPDSTGTHGSNAAFTTNTVYDYATGLPTRVTDPNGLQMRMEYADPLLRPTRTAAYNSSDVQVGPATVTEYGAGSSPSTRWVKVTTDIDATGTKYALSYFDGLGRTWLTQSEDSAGDVFAITCYDEMGRIAKASNPFRGYTSQTCSTSTGMEWTANGYDAAGRPSTVTTPDGAVAGTSYSLATTGGQIGTVVTVIDQAGKLRRSVSNALGQLIRVDEPTVSGSTVSLGSISSPNQATLYEYDTLGNLITVTQGVQTRNFGYDALSRLKQATNPESGTIRYTYDPNGNLKTKWDDRGIKTIYDYDALGRVWMRCYKSVGTSSLGATASCAAAGGEPAEPNTPDVTYSYDNLPNAKGKLTKVSSSVSTTEYTAFDILGRVTGHKQTTDGVAYTTAYAYNLSGALVEETYPSGRVVKNTLDAADGSLSQVQSKRSGGTFRNHANSFVYSAAGAVEKMRLGNGLWENTAFNSRLQPTRIGLGLGADAQDLLKLDYEYGATASANNGNVTKQTITVPGVAHPFVQNYNYDELNRLKSATETQNSTQTWKQTFAFDRFGNRNFDEANTTTLPKNCGTSPSFTVCAADKKIVNPAIDTSNNHLSTSDDYVFDAAGNVIEDAEGRQFTYDAENKQVEVENGSSQLIGQYRFDGDGKRVKKVMSNGETTIFVYDAGSKLIGEYSTEVQPTQDAKTQYLTADHLGTPRINTNAVGAVVSRSDYMPYGEEITSGRSGGQGYVTDDVRQGFTGYENDDETGLDFAQARYYSKSLGRFTSADLPFAGQWLADPQTWNLFIYTSNNPLARIDPNGRRWYYRTSGKTLEIQWVNPNDDGSFTAPEGDGWIAQKPGETLSLYSEENDTTYHLSEFEDGTPYMKGIKTNRGVQYVSLETFTMFRIARGSTSVLSGVFGAARGAWASFLARQAEKKLVKELAEMTTEQLNERVGKSGVEMFRDLFGREFGATIRGAEATKMAREMLESGLKKIPDGLTREQLLAYRQIAVNAVNNAIDKGAQAERIKTIDYLLTKVKN